ncbi:hypothetical protein BDQ17DRAFT_1243536, partial [Cyathus striatus]
SYIHALVSVTILHIVAIITACLRIGYRRKSRRIWWDDYATILPALLEFCNVIGLWMRLQHFSMLRQMKVNLRFLGMALLTTTIWWSRIGMALSIARITPEWSKSRVIILYVTCSFVCNWIGLITAYTILCCLDTSWEFANTDILVCGSAFTASAASMISDIAGDLFLVTLPLHRLWRLRLPLAQRRLVRLVFSTSLLMLTVAATLLICA